MRKKEIIKTEEVNAENCVEKNLRKLFGDIINALLESEMDIHLGNEKYKHVGDKQENYRNGYSKKNVKASIGYVKIQIPRDRNAEFSSIVVPKYTREIFKLETQIMELLEEGNTSRRIREFVEEIYGLEVSDELVSDITERILPEIEKWKKN